MKTLSILMALIVSVLCISPLFAEEASKSKFTVGTSVTVDTELGKGRVQTFLNQLKKSGIDVDQSKLGVPSKKATIQYLTYSNTDGQVSRSEILSDLKAAGYRAAEISELMSIDDGNSGLKENQGVLSFGTIMNISPVNSLLFGAAIIDKGTMLQSMQINEKTLWQKKGLVIPAVSIKNRVRL